MVLKMSEVLHFVYKKSKIIVSHVLWVSNVLESEKLCS